MHYGGLCDCPRDRQIRVGQTNRTVAASALPVVKPPLSVVFGNEVWIQKSWVALLPASTSSQDDEV